MNKTVVAAFASFLFFLFAIPAQAQRSYIRSKIKEKVRADMKEKHAEPQRERGKEALRGITYENDTRYPEPENRVTATLTMQTQQFKKNGKLESTVTSKVVFGPTGECMIMNAGEKEEIRLVFDYEGAANYMVNVTDKTAVKMPLINFTRMAAGLSKNLPATKEDRGEWTKTSEQQTINGYACRKYIYTDDKGNHMDVWVTHDIHIDISENHLFGGSIRDFAALQIDAEADENLPSGFMVRNVYFEKRAKSPSMQMDIIGFDESYDPQYFDLSEYGATDVLDML